jgi:hypothetical protein
VSGKIAAGNATGKLGDAECYFGDNGDITTATVPISGETVTISGTPHHFGTATLSVQEDVALPVGGTVTMTCQNTGASDIPDGPNDLGFAYERLRAIQVVSLH